MGGSFSEGWGLLVAKSGDFSWPPVGTSAGHNRGLFHGHGQGVSTAAMLQEEAVDRFVRRPFDLSVQVLLVPVVWRQRIEIVVVAREAVPDVGPGAERSAIVEGEVAGPTDSAAAYDGCMGSGLFGNPLFEFSVGRGKGEEANDGVFQLVSIAIFLTPAGLSSEGTLGRTACGRFFGARQSCRNGLAGRPESEKSTMLAVLGSRLPRQPVRTCSLDGPGQEGITRGQEVQPAGISMSPCSGFHGPFLVA